MNHFPFAENSPHSTQMAPYPPWKDLPQELITTFSKLLSLNSLDIFNLRSVCKSFHSCIPYPSHLLSPFCPLPLPSPPSSSQTTTTSSCILTATSIFSIRPRTQVSSSSSSSSFNWVVFFDELNHATLCIRRPFSRFDFLPPLDFPTKLSFSDFKFEQLGMFYNVSYVDFTSGKFVKKGSWNSDFNKVVVFGNGVGLVLIDSDRKLWLLRFGDGCEWRVLHDDGNGVRYHDVVEFKGRVLGIDSQAQVYEIVTVESDDISTDPNVIVAPISDVGGKKRLIESFGCLYLVGMKNGVIGEFQVYVLDEKVMKWVEVNGIGDDRVFLFGLDFSVACDAHKFDGLVDGNCMIFNNYSFFGPNGVTNRLLLHMNLRYSDIPVSIYRFEAGAKSQSIDTLPSYCSLFWPPPSWIWPNEKSKLTGTFVAASNRLLKGISDEELKANYQQLSAKIRTIVGGDGISQHELHEMLKNADMHLTFLKDIVQVVETDADIVKNSILYDAEGSCHASGIGNNPVAIFSPDAKARLKLRRLIIVQAGTWSLNVENENGSSDDEWLSNVISQRLGTHVSLHRFLHRLIAMFNRN